MLNWDDLRLFLEVCRRSKLEDVARECQMDATTISRRMKRLEHDLSLTLFERTRRGHSMTPAGEKISALAEEMESTAFEIVAKGASEQSLSGTIRLGAPEGLGTTIIAPALAGFRATHPQIDIDLITLSGFVSVPKRQADMSIMLTRPTAGRIKVRKLGRYELYLYGTESYLDAAEPINELSDLNSHTLIAYTEDLIYSSRLRYLQDLLPGVSPNLRSPSIIAQMNMIEAGSGIGILPAFMASKNEKLIRILPEFTVEREFWLAIHEDVAGLARIREAIDFLLQLEF